MRSPQIKTAIIEDISDILIIQKAGGLSEWSFDDYRREMNRKDSLLLVAKVKNKAIGFLTARLAFDEIDLLNIGVLPEYQRTGVGGLLLNDMFEKICVASAKSIWLEVRKSNFKAIDFYRKKGFVQIQIRKKFYAQPVEDAIVMKYEISKNAPKFLNET